MLWRGVTFILNNLSLWCPASLKKARSNLYLFIGREPEPLSEACELEVLSHSLFLSVSCSVSVCSSWSWKVRLVTDGRHIVSYWSTSWFSFYSRAIYQGSCWSWNNKSGQVVNVIASLCWAQEGYLSESKHLLCAPGANKNNLTLPNYRAKTS